MKHSIHVYERLREMFSNELERNTDGPVILSDEDEEKIAICGLLHDICKVNFYDVEMRNRKNERVSETLNQGDYVEFLTSVTYPGLMRDGKVELPDGITFDMLTIPIVSEAVQAEGIDVGGATGADAAYQAFQIVNGL